jgi:hypothetical protein
MCAMTKGSKSAYRLAALDERLDALDTMDHAALKAEWVRLYGVPAPKKSGKDFLRHAIAYRLQEKTFGGLKPRVRRKLIRLADDATSRSKTKSLEPATKPRPTLRRGARLIRDWNGETHVVEVVDGGFLWRNRSYRSLSAIARAITGARWSGPRFFGLNGTSAETFRS